MGSASKVPDIYPSFGKLYSNCCSICRNLENNKLQGTLPDSLNRESLEVRYGTGIFFINDTHSIILMQHFCADHQAICAFPSPFQHVVRFHPILQLRHHKLPSLTKSSMMIITWEQLYLERLVEFCLQLLLHPC